MNKPTKQQKHDEARDALINAIAYRRALRVLYDARNSTSIEQEVENLLRENQPLSGMTDAQLVDEWEAFDPDEDPESGDYVPPKLNLTGLRRRGKKRTKYTSMRQLPADPEVWGDAESAFYWAAEARECGQDDLRARECVIEMLQAAGVKITPATWHFLIPLLAEKLGVPSPIWKPERREPAGS